MDSLKAVKEKEINKMKDSLRNIKEKPDKKLKNLVKKARSCRGIYPFRKRRLQFYNAYLVGKFQANKAIAIGNKQINKATGKKHLAIAFNRQEANNK